MVGNCFCLFVCLLVFRVESHWVVLAFLIFAVKARLPFIFTDFRILSAGIEGVYHCTSLSTDVFKASKMV